jgi:hypothetical protein
MGKPAVLLELRYWKACGFIGTLRVIGTSLWENLRFYWNASRYWNFVMGKPAVLWELRYGNAARYLNFVVGTLRVMEQVN